MRVYMEEKSSERIHGGGIVRIYVEGGNSKSILGGWEYVRVYMEGE